MADMNLENIHTDSTQQPVEAGNGTLTKGAKFGWFLLGFCVPLAGLILWLVWGKEYPEKSRCCRNGFIAGLISIAVVYILAFVGSVIMMVNISSSLPGA